MDLVAAAEEHCDGQRYQPAGPIDIIFEEHDDLETGVFRIRPSKASRPRATGLTGQQRAVRPREEPDAGAAPVGCRPPVRPRAGSAGAGAVAGAAGAVRRRRLPAPGQPAPEARRRG